MIDIESPYAAIERLVDGFPGRVALLRGAGNAIVPQVAATFIQAALSVIGETYG